MQKRNNKKTGTILAFVLLYCGIIGICAVIAPLVKHVLDFKFHRILARCLTVGTFLFVWFLMKYFRVNLREYGKRMGLSNDRFAWRSFWRGFLLSAVFIGGVSVVQVFLGFRTPRITLAWYAFLAQIGKAAATGIVVAYIEETFFRGVVFRSLARVSLWGSFVVTNLFYAAVHFFRSGNVLVAKTPGIIDSFRVMGGYFSSFSNDAHIWPAFVGLFLFGCVLTAAYLRSKTLLMPIGIHAGAVFIIKTNSAWSAFHEATNPLVFGSKWVYDGIIGWGVLLLMFICVLVVIKKKEGDGHVELLG